MNMHLSTRIRFTPAYAGKIELTGSDALLVWVHPRIRGEDLCTALMHLRPLGSPPHTRGRFRKKLDKPFRAWFTPAYAGKIIFCYARDGRY